jgi:hypothetical protein
MAKSKRSILNSFHCIPAVKHTAQGARPAYKSPKHHILPSNACNTPLLKLQH